VLRDHGEHPVIGVQHVHRQDRRTAGPSRADQRANQIRSDAPALPRVGHHYPDLDDRAAGIDLAGGDPVPDDLATATRHHDVGITAAR